MKKSTKAYVHYVNDDSVKSILEDLTAATLLWGGKGANLFVMKRVLDINVPEHLTISTEACNEFLKNNNTFPKGTWEQVKKAIKKMEADTGQVFGDPKNPLFVSCRSGAAISMPGMMDTILNIGLNDETAKEIIKKTKDSRHVYDNFRRLIQMTGTVVFDIKERKFENVLEDMRKKQNVDEDSKINAKGMEEVTKKFKDIFKKETKMDFPSDPYKLLQMATTAVFKSWNGKRAVDYRKAAKIRDDLGTAVNIQRMVFGNKGDNSATGVCMTRNGKTGKRRMEGDYLINAQGEEVVAGMRDTKDLEQMALEMPEIHTELVDIGKKLELYFRDMQDIEFTIEEGTLFLLQTRKGKRTAMAAFKIACDLVHDGIIKREEAVRRITPDDMEFFLHPQFRPEAIKEAEANGMLLGTGLDVSPGAGVGQIALDADLAQKWAEKDNKDVIMVRPETKPDDVHGMIPAQAILTARGGKTSHAALVARGFNIPAVVGAKGMKIIMGQSRMIVFGEEEVLEGEVISVDGNEGKIYKGAIETFIPDFENEDVKQILQWAFMLKTMGVYANVDSGPDAKIAVGFGAEGSGLVRSEHTLFDDDKLPIIRKMILADRDSEQREALQELLPHQIATYTGIIEEMGDRPVVIRLLDPPLHEFLPEKEELERELYSLKFRHMKVPTLEEYDIILEEVIEKGELLERVKKLAETNPMMGVRGVRLANLIPELPKMQTRAIIEAACDVQTKLGVTVKPKIMIPLTGHFNELKEQMIIVRDEANRVMDARGMEIEYSFGTMIEIPRAAITANELAEISEFFSFGTNDLTQMTWGISRDDAEENFLLRYLEDGLLTENPFETLDRNGVGELMKIALEKGRKENKELETGICGEHGGDYKSVIYCHLQGLSYVSCSPYRIPVAILAAAHAALSEDHFKDYGVAA